VDTSIGRALFAEVQKISQLRAPLTPPRSSCNAVEGVQTVGAPSLAVQPPPRALELDDAPGAYVVAHQDTLVSSSIRRSGESEAIGSLPSGTFVNVLEVVHLADSHRVRARIEHPPGWISLLNTETGYRWANPYLVPEPTPVFPAELHGHSTQTYGEVPVIELVR